jgi:hypothetical protein
MEKRGSKHSARVSSVYAGELVGWAKTLGVQSDMEYVDRTFAGFKRRAVDDIMLNIVQGCSRNETPHTPGYRHTVIAEQVLPTTRCRNAPVSLADFAKA